jgi:endogenous inhibitor of DNA gyrase (YacG/DUF329 family)
MPIVKCPTCQRDSEWTNNNPWRPFCSQRCKLIDLGDWTAEKHAIPLVELDDESQITEDFKPEY